MKNLGFTLIELLIVLAIISILSTISYPLYTGHLVRMRRTYAITALMDRSGNMEEQYIINGNTYDNVILEDINNYYHLVKTTTNDTYVLSAVPLGKQAALDALCGSLTIDQNGNKGISGSGSIEECWR